MNEHLEKIKHAMGMGTGTEKGFAEFFAGVGLMRMGLEQAGTHPTAFVRTGSCEQSWRIGVKA
jgi:hypothetical protein